MSAILRSPTCCGFKKQPGLTDRLKWKYRIGLRLQIVSLRNKNKLSVLSGGAVLYASAGPAQTARPARSSASA